VRYKGFDIVHILINFIRIPSNQRKYIFMQLRMFQLHQLAQSHLERNLEDVVIHPVTNCPTVALLLLYIGVYHMVTR
jgi:hypothetical protein